MTYRTARDIVIQAGTKVDVEPPHTRSTGVRYASILAAVTKNSTAEWSMPLDEAIAAGLVERAGEAA